jgi:hypothetical protein
LAGSRASPRRREGGKAAAGPRQGGGEGEEGKMVFPFPNLFYKCMISPIHSTIKINA